MVDMSYHREYEGMKKTGLMQMTCLATALLFSGCKKEDMQDMFTPDVNRQMPETSGAVHKNYKLRGISIYSNDPLGDMTNAVTNSGQGYYMQLELYDETGLSVVPVIQYSGHTADYNDLLAIGNTTIPNGQYVDARVVFDQMTPVNMNTSRNFNVSGRLEWAGDGEINYMNPSSGGGTQAVSVVNFESDGPVPVVGYLTENPAASNPQPWGTDPFADPFIQNMFQANELLVERLTAGKIPLTLDFLEGGGDPNIVIDNTAFNGKTFGFGVGGDEVTRYSYNLRRFP